MRPFDGAAQPPLPLAGQAAVKLLLQAPILTQADYTTALLPAPDALKLAVPKAFVTLTAGHAPDAATAAAILAFCREKLAAYKRIRRIQFTELPKTISGKIRRVELRRAEEARAMPPVPLDGEFFE